MKFLILFSLFLISFGTIVEDELKALPTSVDWVAKGAVTPVRNSSPCASDWASSVVDAVSSSRKIAGHKLDQLSVNEVAMCVGGAGCEGGTLSSAYDFIKKHGVCNATSYDNTAKKCASSSCKALAKIAILIPIKKSEDSLKAAVARAPIAVQLYAGCSQIQFYTGGVFNDSRCTTGTPDFSALLVGYGEDAKAPFWKLKFDWGTEFGEQGYVRIARGNNMLNILGSQNYRFVLEKPAPSNVVKEVQEATQSE
eukprot:TRINITY_DN10279_c0_g1_i1.p1 TRINITY_DN10279_c0_g1~~TRINITY_DN10279_c0_g1_i1.p1  ORF type:complete len:253 (+),score=80.41 TRINITY_DN10279_c0_g1_i1:77-835(+)